MCKSIGTYNPLAIPADIKLDFEKAITWLRNGAQPSETAKAILAYKNTFFSPSDTNESVIAPIESTPHTATVSNNDNVTTHEVKGIHYKVQLEAGTKKIDTKPSNFKGLEPISFTQEKKLYKYFYGDEIDYEACKKRLAEAKSKGYKSAYIVTFDNK